MSTEPTRDVSHDRTPEVGWGTPAQPSQRPVPPPQPRSGRNGWSTLRMALFWSVIVLAVPAIGFGVYAIAEDMSDTSDMWHGFGIAIGLILAVPCLVLGVLAGLGLRSMRRRGRDGGRVHAVVIGMLLVAVLLFVGLTPFLLLPVLLGALLLLSVFADTGGART